MMDIVYKCHAVVCIKNEWIVYKLQRAKVCFKTNFPVRLGSNVREHTLHELVVVIIVDLFARVKPFPQYHRGAMACCELA